MSKQISFYTLVITQTLSMIGSRMTSIGIGIYLYQTTGKAAPLLLMAFFNELPGMLASSFAGVLVDRWDRRRVMLLADFGQAIGSLILLGSLLSGNFQVWHLYIIVLFQGSFAIFQGPAESAAITMLMEDSQRTRANAIREMAFPFAGVIAPVFAGLLFAAAGITAVIVVDMATFFIAVLALSLIHIPSPTTTDEGAAAHGNAWQELLGGLRFLGRRQPLLILIIYITFINFLLNGPLELSIPYLLSLSANTATLGTLIGVMSLGALAGAALAAISPNKGARIKRVCAAMLLNGAMLFLFGIVHETAVLAIILFLAMVPLPFSQALNVSIIQVKTPPDMQGRIFATIDQLGYLGSTLSFLLVGLLVDRVLEPAVKKPGWAAVAPLVGGQSGSGMGLVLVVTGALILLATLIIIFRPEVRQIEKILPDYDA
jgi:MFS transporter, DHA3 family, macrolide efflux protein